MSKISVEVKSADHLTLRRFAQERLHETEVAIGEYTEYINQLKADKEEAERVPTKWWKFGLDCITGPGNAELAVHDFRQASRHSRRSRLKALLMTIDSFPNSPITLDARTLDEIFP